MERDQIIRMAREAGYQHPDAVGQCEDFAYFDLERFAKLVAAAERKEILKHQLKGADVHEACDIVMAADIRARGQQ